MPIQTRLVELPNVPLSAKVLKALSTHGAVPFVATLPLTEEGSYVRVHPNVEDGDNENRLRGQLRGQLVFIPGKSLFLRPASLPCSDGFRSGPTGNPRLQFLFIVTPTRNLEVVCQAMSAEGAIANTVAPLAGMLFW